MEPVAISLENLEKLVRGQPTDLDAHLKLVKRDISIAGTKVVLHCHFIMVDANRNLRLNTLVETMINRIIPYAIKRSRFEDAMEVDYRNKDGANILRLGKEAAQLFTDIANSGEGGEFLLFLLTEYYLRIPQVLCKMSLKTNSQDHYKGADGVYAHVTNENHLALYWGESKIHADIQQGIRECFQSLAPFLKEPTSDDARRSRDIMLLSDQGDLNDPNLLRAFKAYLNSDNPLSNKLEHRGVALVGFDNDCYGNPLKLMDEIEKEVIAQIEDWSRRVKGRIEAEKLEDFEIQLFCLPLPKAEEFRKAILTALTKQQ